MKNKKNLTFYIIGSILSIFGAIGHMFEVNFSAYLFSLGAALIIALKFLAMDQKVITNKRLHRLNRIGFMSSLLLALAAYCMFTDSNLWVVALLLYSVLSFFLSFRG